LGIYRRDEVFPIPFVNDLCLLCSQTKIGQLQITPWKSIIVKDIESQHKKLWDFVLGAHRINVRHASNELNWQVEDLCEDGLILKRYIVSQFDKEDLRTFGLCFAIKTRPKSGLFGSVIIRRQPGKYAHKKMERFDILYTKDFNPNSKELILFRGQVTKENLPVYLSSLCKYYYELQRGSELLAHNAYQEKMSDETLIEVAGKKIHQCPDCFTVYDDEFGDPVNEVTAGVSFGDLPVNYSCPTCGEPKGRFIEIEKSLGLC
jgi:rubredoxin